MLLKFFVKLLIKKNHSYHNAVRIGKEVYTISIEKYETFDEKLKRLKSALEDENNQSTES